MLPANGANCIQRSFRAASHEPCSATSMSANLLAKGLSRSQIRWPSCRLCIANTAPMMVILLQKGGLMLTSTVESDDTSSATISRLENQKIIVAKFLAIVEESLDCRLNMEETSRQIGVPSRSLRDALKRNLGLSPSQYVLHRRMDMARSALQKGNCAVSDAARQSGFCEMGRFATAYRKLYGEPPSITLKRASGRGQPGS